MLLTLEQFKIKLIRVDDKNKELIRIGRNQDFVRKNHLYQEIISQEEHEKWFKKINTKEHYFFFIEVNRKKVGAVYIKDFFYGLDSSKCGAFIWDKSHLASKTPILAILIALDFFYYRLGAKHTESFVLTSNTAAIKMNTFFGFSFNKIKDENYYKITLTLKDYLKRRSFLIKFAERASKSTSQLIISGKPNKNNLDEINALLE